MTKPFSKENFTSDILPKLLLLLSALALLTYTILRAHYICMTHDESGSYRIWLNFDIFSCFVDPGCWRTANLHFLFVLLMKGTVGLFGDSELAIRLPSIIGHLVYLYFSWRLVKMWSSSSWLVLCGFIILNANPFLLEFFSLARGYGLAMTCMMASIFYVSDFIKNKNNGAAWGMFVWAFLAVFSNYTMLNYYACMIAVVALVFIFLYLKKIETNLLAWKKLLFAGVVVSGFMGVILYMPITTLSKVGEFEYGAVSFWDTISSNIKRSMYGVKYFNEFNVEIFAAVLILLLTIGGVASIRWFFKEPHNKSAQFSVAAFLLPFLTGLASIVQHYLLDVNYLVGRTALIFLPLVAITVFMTFVQCVKFGKKRWLKFLPFLIAGFVVVHAIRSFQFTHSSEWWYDSHTKAVLEYLDEKTPEGKTVTLGVHWIFQPTADFYFRSIPFDFCEPLVYEKEYRKDDLYDYYYIQPGDESKLDSAYQLEKKFAWAGVLMVRKNID